MSRVIAELYMVDLETVSLANNAAIISIGVVAFNATGATRTFYRKVALESSLAAGLHQSESTMAWWATQPESTRVEAFSGEARLKGVLEHLTRFLGERPIIWGNGAVADNVWLKSAYEACDLPVPWHYTDDRFFRSVMALYPGTPRVPPTEAHHALADAEAQVETLLNALVPFRMRSRA